MSDVESGGPAGLSVQPMVHVERMAESVAFYEALGGRLLFGSRDGDWCLLEFGASRLALLAHPPGDCRRETVELQFACDGAALDSLERSLSERRPAALQTRVADEAFGRMMKLTSPDGLLVKVVEVERDLVQ